MSRSTLSVVFLFYGLAFFSMGLVVALEGRRATDERLRHALRPLAAFGLLHGLHEWLEMLQTLGALPAQDVLALLWDAARLGLLAYSFLSLAAFGASLLAPTPRLQRVSLLLPLGQCGLWATGLLVMRGQFAAAGNLWDVADVWSRYVLGIPAALVASAGLIAQQRAFRKAGMARFGRDSLWAAVAFAWYGLVGQTFTRPSPLPPSQFINQNLFLQFFGFPVQLVRAVAAMVAALFVIRFLRAIEVEIQRQIATLQVARLEEAERREALRGELLRRVVAAQEAERQRIARELHDATGQALTAIGLGLRGTALLLRQEPVAAGRNLRQLEGMVGQSLEELQRLIADLRPPHLDDLGLPAALRWWAGEVQHRTSLSIDVEIAGREHELAAPHRIALFRVAQEAITNVLKHAQATYAGIELRYGQEAVTLTIEDNGRGFDPASHLLSEGGRPSWGLLGMRERASLLGGTFYLYSQPGQGSRIEVTIPYRQQAPAPAEEEYHDHEIAPG